MSEATEPNNRLGTRFRFSLLTVMLVVVLAALSLTLIKVYSELTTLRRENQWYRDEYGILTITDRSKLHAIRLRSVANSERTFTWRVWVPEGHSYVLHFDCDDVSSSGYPKPGMSLPAREAGEQTIRLDFDFAKDADKLWKYYIQFAGGAGSGPVSFDWFSNQEDGSGATWEGTSDSTCTESDEDHRLLLARFRVTRAALANQNTDGMSLPGYILWLERL